MFESREMPTLVFYRAVFFSHAVKFMHDQKLTHTDLKPGRVR